jgi:hypothetical protein
MLHVSCSQSYCFFTNIFSLPDKMQVQVKNLYVCQNLLSAAIWNWLRLSSHDVIFAAIESATAPHLCVWNFGKYTSIYRVTRAHWLVGWKINHSEGSSWALCVAIGNMQKWNQLKHWWNYFSVILKWKKIYILGQTQLSYILLVYIVASILGLWRP